MEGGYYVILLLAGIENRIKCNDNESAADLYDTLEAEGYCVEMHYSTTVTTQLRMSDGGRKSFSHVN